VAGAAEALSRDKSEARKMLQQAAKGLETLLSEDEDTREG
jgi:hypothetical protein